MEGDVSVTVKGAPAVEYIVSPVWKSVISILKFKDPGGRLEPSHKAKILKEKLVLIELGWYEPVELPGKEA